MPQFDSPQANKEQPEAANPPTAAPPPGQQLAPVPQREDDAGMLAQWEESPAAFSGSFDVTTQTGQDKLWKMLKKGDSQLSAEVNKWLPVTDWMAHVVELTNEQTGESRTTMRLVLLLADGTTVSTTSGIFAKGFSYAMQLNGRGPWDPPMEVKASIAQGNGVNKYLAFDGARRAGQDISSKPAKTGKNS